jgi:hypothetical protein
MQILEFGSDKQKSCLIWFPVTLVYTTYWRINFNLLESTYAKVGMNFEAHIPVPDQPPRWVCGCVTS